jgi:hypothetical protein
MRHKLHEACFIQHSFILAKLPDALQDDQVCRLLTSQSHPSISLPLSHPMSLYLHLQAYARLISHTKFVMLTSSLAFSS